MRLGTQNRHIPHVGRPPSSPPDEGLTPLIKVQTIPTGNQPAKGLEPCTTRSLEHLWHQQNKTEDAQPLVTTTYGPLTAGHDTRELKEAKAGFNTLA